MRNNEKSKESSVSALVILYYILKVHRPAELNDTTEMRRNVFKSCHISRNVSDESLQALDYFLNHYEDLFDDHPLLAAAIIYFFVGKTEITLEIILNRIDVLSRFSKSILVIYVGMRLNDLQDQFEKKFKTDNERIRVNSFQIPFRNSINYYFFYFFLFKDKFRY